MSATTHVTLIKDDRVARRKADRELARQAVERLRSSEGWQRWLSTRRHFHRYCFVISGPNVFRGT